MTRLRMIMTGVWALVAVLAVLAAHSAGARAVTVAPPRAQLTQFSCVRALDPVNRSVGVSAVMRPVPGTQRMLLRFQLLQQLAGAPAVMVRGGDLGSFRSPPNPTLGRLPGDVWRKVKQVINLNAPAAYQFRVTFRWVGAHNRVLSSATHYSRVCHQRELRPDLLVSSIAVAPIAGHPNHELYTATIANQGATGAGPFEVLFTPGDGSTPLTQTVKWLAAHATRQLQFTGPVCTSTSPSTVTADAADQIDDFDRTNNTLAATCPATG